MGNSAEAIVQAEAILERLRPVLADPELRKTAQDGKRAMGVLRTAGVELQGLEFDTMLAERGDSGDPPISRTMYHTYRMLNNTRLSQLETAAGDRESADRHMAEAVEHCSMMTWDDCTPETLSDVAERLTIEQIQRGGFVAISGQSTELDNIDDAVFRQVQAISVVGPVDDSDPVGIQRIPQVRYVGLEAPFGLWRCVLAPHRLNAPVHGHPVGAVSGQHCNQRSGFAPAEFEFDAVVEDPHVAQ